MKKSKRSSFKPITQTLCIGGALLGGGVLAHAEDQSTDDLKARVAQLEALAAKEGLQCKIENIPSTCQLPAGSLFLLRWRNLPCT